jgi:hypothetical protein
VTTKTRIIRSHNLQRSIAQWKMFAAHPGNKRKLKEINQQIAIWEQMLAMEMAADAIRLHSLGIRWE